jgi:hypothetical protein
MSSSFQSVLMALHAYHARILGAARWDPSARETANAVRQKALELVSVDRGADVPISAELLDMFPHA